ncbi:hypothetical protein SS50377_26140 [Spironucleus salmonicida]|uniref:Uncharacterized protein n=1 Tax=Spironucleus salmonicida TaxID=348837 RepID=V6LRM4_9EUKA|nr:hypothetical protein SS50377_26140 [Spironucleus salmonicida]|eukprot:EST46346.1 Hypothetical protein SS50377_13659 [Spironucleus salmonicida]
MKPLVLLRNDDAAFKPTVIALRQRIENAQKPMKSSRHLIESVSIIPKPYFSYSQGASKLFKAAMQRPDFRNRSLQKMRMQPLNLADVKRDLFQKKLEDGLVVDIKEEYAKQVEDGLADLNFEVDQFL